MPESELTSSASQTEFGNERNLRDHDSPSGDQLHRDRHICEVCETRRLGPDESERCRLLSLTEAAAGSLLLSAEAQLAKQRVRAFLAEKKAMSAGP